MEKHMIAKSAVRWVKSANVISPCVPFPQPRHIQQDDFDFMINKKYGYGGRKL